MLNQAEVELLNEFGHYTIEALVVYVLSALFSTHDNTVVRVATLVERLDYCVRAQAALLKKSRRCNIPYVIKKDIGFKITGKHRTN